MSRPAGSESPLPLDLLLAELPSAVRAAIDTTVFAQSGRGELEEIRRLAAVTNSHVVAYDLRVTGVGLPLCAAVGQADLPAEHVAALRAAERELSPWIALVAYARPVELRQPEVVLARAAAVPR